MDHESSREDDIKKNLKNLTALLKKHDGKQLITNDEFSLGLTDIVNSFAQMRSASQKINKDHEDLLNTVLKQLQAEYDRILVDVEKTSQKAESSSTGGMKKMEAMMTMCQEMCDEIKAMEFHDGADGKDGKDGKDGADGKDGSPDTPDQVIDKVNSSKKQIKKERVEGLEQAILNSASNAVKSLPVTTSLINGKRAKNLNFIGATVDVVGDTAKVTPNIAGTVVSADGSVSVSNSYQQFTYFV